MKIGIRSMASLHVKTFFSIHEIDAAAWDKLGGQLPFQSHRWYAFGERVMADCAPVYLLVYDMHTLVARASMWLVRNEPLPKMSRFVRILVQALLKRRPLFVCRSPMANASGVMVENSLERRGILTLLTKAAIAEGRHRRASIVLFDFLDEREAQDWPSDSVRVNMPSPGTILKNRWQSLEDYLADGNKKDRQHYKRSLREAQKLGIFLSQHQAVPDIDTAMDLIRKVESRYSSSHNPWTRSLLENIKTIQGTWLEAHMGEKLVGCGLIVEDNNAQMTTALGLADNMPYVYFLLVYASLETAFNKKVSLLRWGSGAYEVKQKLGFELEKNNNSVLFGTNRLIRLLNKII
ncbi:MAG TPA: peptidogalycan biosysnthesis protein [Anaerolineales bacterium]|nr:peptidogalycan biosysnthesis protein [Anaerolineales bacterium]